MYRLTVLYGRPTDPEAFDRYYREVHLPIAARMKGLTRWTLTWVTASSGDMELPAVHLIADLYAPDKAAMDAILASPEGIAAREDLANFVTGGATFLSGDEQEVPLR